MKKIFAVVAGLFLLAGCEHVQSTVTVFHTLPEKGDGSTIAVVSADKAKIGTLEFRAYAAEVEQYLSQAGYSVVQLVPNSPPRYVAVFNYGIDDGTLVTSTYTIPQVGVTGYSSSTTMGTISTFGNTATLNATTTKTPEYGVTGYATGTTQTRVYKRAIILDILDSTKLKPTDPGSVKAAEVYQAKLTSDGSCASIAAVMPDLLAALFKNFPGDSGRAETISVKSKAKC